MQQNAKCRIARRGSDQNWHFLRTQQNPDVQSSSHSLGQGPYFIFLAVDRIDVDKKNTKFRFIKKQKKFEREWTFKSSSMQSTTRRIQSITILDSARWWWKASPTQYTHNDKIESFDSHPKLLSLDYNASVHIRDANISIFCAKASSSQLPCSSHGQLLSFLFIWQTPKSKGTKAEKKCMRKSLIFRLMLLSLWCCQHTKIGVLEPRSDDVDNNADENGHQRPITDSFDCPRFCTRSLSWRRFGCVDSGCVSIHPSEDEYIHPYTFELHIWKSHFFVIHTQDIYWHSIPLWK